MDPGTSNLGLCLGDARTGIVERTGTFRVGDQWQLKGQNCLTIQRSVAVIRTFLSGAVPNAFLVEANSAVPGNKALESQVDGVIGFFSASPGTRVACVRPTTVRAHFRLPSTSNRAENKKATRECLMGKGYPPMADSHQDDTILLLCYFREVLFSQGGNSTPIHHGRE